MKRALWLMALAATLGPAAFVAGSRMHRPGCDSQPPGGTAMDWLKQEFALDDEVIARVRGLHDSYKPACEEMCRRVVANRRRIDASLEKGGGYSAELDAALREAADLRFESQRLYLQHVHAVAAAMPPEPSRRYTAMMNARIFNHCECASGLCLH